MNADKILNFLDEHEIDFRIESNFCCGFIFYFLDGSVYPRRYYDDVLENQPNKVICESIDHLITKAISNELVKDWKHRIESESLVSMFEEVHNYLLTKGDIYQVYLSKNK